MEILGSQLTGTCTLPIRDLMLNVLQSQPIENHVRSTLYIAKKSISSCVFYNKQNISSMESTKIRKLLVF